MMILGAVIMTFTTNDWIKHFGITLFVSSFFVMSKKRLSQ